MPRDTKTRYQGVYARHKKGCSAEDDPDTCSCKPSYWGKAWDSAAGKPRKTTLLTTAAAANAARSDLKRQLASGIVPASQSMRVKAAIEAFLAAIESGRALNKRGRKYKPSAVRDLRGALDNHVEPALGAKRLAHVRRADVQQLVDELDCSGSSVRTVVNSIHSLYTWAQDRELVDHDPASRVRLPAMDATPRDRVATVTEMTELLAVLDIADALPYALAVYTTARRNEIRHLDLDDVDSKLDVIYLGADGNARKSRASQRPFPIVKPLRLIIRRAQLARDPDAGKLLCPGLKPGGRNSGRLSFEALQTRADAAWEKAKLTRITAHECKHTAVSWLEAAGVRQVEISMLAGHALQHGGAPVTARYTHALPGYLERAREQFDAYLARETKRKATG
jgi:integrase